MHYQNGESAQNGQNVPNSNNNSSENTNEHAFGFDSYDDTLWPSQQLAHTDFIYDTDRLGQFMRERGINSSEDISFTQIFTDFLKNLRPGLDITRISLPSFLLRPYSYLESAAENSTPDMQLLLRYLGSSQAAPAAVTTANSVVSPLDSTTSAVLNNKKKKESAIFGTVIDRLASVPSTPELRILAITRWMLVMLANTPQKGFRGVKVSFTSICDIVEIDIVLTAMHVWYVCVCVYVIRCTSPITQSWGSSSCATGIMKMAARHTSLVNR